MQVCHLLTGPPHRRQHRAGVGLGRGLGIHGAWSGFHKSRRDVRVRDHPCQDHGGGPFAVEGVTPIAKVLQFDMSDGEPRLLVGTPTKSGGQITLLAERIFRIQTSEVDIYEKQMTAVHETLQGDKIQPVASKRPADSMVQETPSKKFAPAFLAE